MLSRVTSAASSSSLMESVPSGRRGKHEVAHLARRVPDTDLGVLGKLDAELAKHGSRLGDHPGAVGGALVPGRRQAEHRPRVARAQRADDDVVDLGRVLDDDHRVALEPAVAELADRGGAVQAEPLAVRGVDPGAGDDPGAVLRAEVALVALDDRVDLVGREQPLLDEHCLERRGAQRELVVAVVVVVAHTGLR